MSEFKKRAVEVSFDLSKQFISLAFAGVAFAVGLSAGNGSAVSSILFWVVITFFAVSSILGFLYLMRGASSLSADKEFDIYETTCRLWAVLQILLVFFGVALLLILHLKLNKKDTSGSGSNIEVTVNQNKLQYQVPDGKDIKIVLDKDGKLDFQAISASTTNATKP
jgi:hypothetical protein